MQTQSNFHLIGHFVGNTKETNISLSFSFKMTLHTSELRKDLAQSNLVVLRSEEMKKKSYQATGTAVLGEFPNGARNLTHSLISYDGFFLV
jgi:hypothetical protein